MLGANLIFNNTIVSIFEVGDTTHVKNPITLEIIVQINNSLNYTYHLNRNNNLNVNIPVIVSNKIMENDENVNVFYYITTLNDGFLSVESKFKDGIYKRQIKGQLYIENSLYGVIPLGLFEQNSTANDEKYKIVSENYIINEKYKKLKYIKTRKKTFSKNFYSETVNNRYIIETVFYIDHTIWERYLKINSYNSELATSSIKFDFFLFINGINMAYKSFSKENVYINIILTKIHIATKLQDSEFYVTLNDKNEIKNGIINGDILIEEFGKWVKKSSSLLHNPDHIMLWTRYDLFGDNTIGYAYTNSICLNGYSLSLNKFIDMTSWITATHELGHSLGALHDGEDNDCSEKEAYIMNSGKYGIQPDKMINQLKFSSCSINEIVNHLFSLGKQNCLTNRVLINSNIYNSKIAGVTFNANMQCSVYNGIESSECEEYQDKHCSNLICIGPYDNQCVMLPIQALNGTKCGSKKWCLDGNCVSKQPNTKNFILKEKPITLIDILHEFATKIEKFVIN
ncbi:hypothetical protein A3Q56_07642 [Intoshia linei]|uniref:Peptidase M12B domain-containing protein n=1 Tax=Intoshia linei TaxID=1819745 RepID=A0A177ATC5_9BILA|nr:hypothetical protein A3Q56_07642 [Intoshia linei]